MLRFLLTAYDQIVDLLGRVDRIISKVAKLPPKQHIGKCYFAKLLLQVPKSTADDSRSFNRFDIFDRSVDVGHSFGHNELLPYFVSGFVV